MIDLFVSSKDEVTIKFAVTIDKDGKMYVDINKKALEEMMSDEECEIEGHEVIFKRPSFGDVIGITDKLYQTSLDGKISINPLADRYQKMAILMRSWSLKDDKGNLLPINEKNIKSLNPLVADIIVSQLELEIGSLLG